MHMMYTRLLYMYLAVAVAIAVANNQARTRGKQIQKRHLRLLS
jgi:hypothetical protein